MLHGSVFLPLMLLLLQRIILHSSNIKDDVVNRRENVRRNVYDNTEEIVEGMEWFDSCAKKVNIPQNKFCPGTLFDIGQLANYYNQISLEEAYNAHVLYHTTTSFTSTVSFPHAFYMDGIDINGTMRIGTELLFGLEYENALDEHKLERYAFVDTIIGKYKMNDT